MNDYTVQQANVESDIYADVVLTQHGYYTLKRPPNDKEREEYYKKVYYERDNGPYAATYTDEEYRLFDARLKQKLLLIKRHLPLANNICSFLDIGCGEGFAVSFFKKRGFDVLGIDYSSTGITNHNPSIVDDVIIGDLYAALEDIRSSFDVINMDTVLEHVPNPEKLLDETARLLSPGGIVIIKVPNDFSALQHYSYNHGLIAKPFWVAPLDHISYFSADSLINICHASGLEAVDILGERIIEIFLLNQNTNYFQTPSLGKSCHSAIVELENLIYGISPEKALDFFRALGNLGLGRHIIGVFKKI